MDNKNEQIRIINMSSYIPVAIVEKQLRNKEWVGYGENNDYFQYVINRYNNSPTNGALINGIADMIYGKGLSARDANRKPGEYAQMISLFKKKDVKKISYDLKLQGMCAMQIIWSKDHTKIVEVAHIPVETLRAETVNEDGDIEGYYYAKDWTDIHGKKKPVRIPAFGTSKEGLEIFFVRPYRAGSMYYSAPDYSQSLTYANAEEDIATYHINHIQNGFSPRTIINFNNGQATTDEARRDISTKLSKKLAGSTGDPYVISFNEGVEQETTFNTIDVPNIHEQFKYVADEAKEMLRFAHKAQPILFGINTANGFASNADEIKNASIFMNNQVIKPFQELLLDAFDEILAVNEVSLDLFFKTLQPWKSEDEDDIEENNEEPTNTTEE